MRFVIRSEIAASESIRGYVHRIGSLNSVRGVYRVLSHAKLQRSYLTMPCALDGLSRLSGMSKERLEQSSYWPLANGKYRFGPTWVARTQLNLTRPRVCPKCLAECGVIPRIWDLKAYAVCHKHGIRLAEVCSSCNHPLTWERSDLYTCRCGTSLSALPVEPADSGAKQASTIIANLASGRDGFDFPFPVHGLDATLATLWFVGTLIQLDQEWYPLYRSAPSIDETSKILNGAIDAMAEWPNGFRIWLKGCLLRSKTSAPDHCLRYFGRGPSRLRSLVEAQNVTPDIVVLVREAMAECGYSPKRGPASYWDSPAVKDASGWNLVERREVLDETARRLNDRKQLGGYERPARAVLLRAPLSGNANGNIASNSWTESAGARRGKTNGSTK